MSTMILFVIMMSAVNMILEIFKKNMHAFLGWLCAFCGWMLAYTS